MFNSHTNTTPEEFIDSWGPGASSNIDKSSSHLPGGLQRGDKGSMIMGEREAYLFCCEDIGAVYIQSRLWPSKLLNSPHYSG